MEEKIRAARMKATLLYPYLTTALLSITMHESNEVPTMAVTMSGKLMWNPDFIAKLSINETAAVLVHEIWHLLRMHGERAPADENTHGVWNIACDCAINDSLRGLPQDCVYPSTFRMEDHLTEEEYYEQLLKLPRIEVFIKGVGSGDCGSGARGGDKESGPLTKLDKTLIAKYTAEQIKACGNVPYDIERWAESVLNPKIPWDRELRSRFLSSAARAIGKTDFTYSKGSRRAACTKAILPGMVSYKPKVALIIDTSGSMSEKELSMCLAEVKGLLRALASRVTVYVADATVHSKNSVASIGEIKLMGGGGTDMGFAIREADKDRPDIIVVLSDFYTPWGDKPRAEVIGVCIGGSIEGAPSWMKAIKVE